MVLVHGGGGTAHGAGCGSGMSAATPPSPWIPAGRFGRRRAQPKTSRRRRAAGVGRLVRAARSARRRPMGLSCRGRHRAGPFLAALAGGGRRRAHRSDRHLLGRLSDLHRRRSRLAIQFAAPVYGCGFLGQDSGWKAQFEQMGPELAGRWLSLWDPSVYLPQAKMPLLWVSGDLDLAYPLGSLQKSYRLPPGERYLAVRHAMPHGHPSGETPPEIWAFAEQQNAGAVPLARMTEQGVDGRRAWARFVGGAPAVKGAICIDWRRRPVAKAAMDRRRCPVRSGHRTGECRYDRRPDGLLFPAL